RSLRGWMGGAESASPKAVIIDPNGIFNIIYSSGTTGEPKGIVHSHQMRWAQLTRAGAVGGHGPASVTIVSTPLYSDTSLVSLLATIGYGGCAVLIPRFDPVEFLRIAEQYRATNAMLVPAQYRRIMTVPDFDRYDLSSFVMKNSTSAPFSREL